MTPTALCVVSLLCLSSTRALLVESGNDIDARITETGSTPRVLRKLEAEDDVILEGSKTSSIADGYTGSGYVHMTKRQESVAEWADVLVPKSSNYTLRFRYSSGATEMDRSCVLKINGEKHVMIPFKPTQKWSNWKDVEVEGVELKKGNTNSIRLEYPGVERGPNVDSIEIISDEDSTTEEARNLQDDFRNIVIEAETSDVNTGWTFEDTETFGKRHGSGYMRCIAPGCTLELDIPVSDDGIYGMRLRMANAASRDRKIEYYVNDVSIGSLTVNSSSTWFANSVRLPLETGNNKVVIKSDRSDYVLDRVVITAPVGRIGVGVIEAEDYDLIARADPYGPGAQVHKGYEGTGYMTLSKNRAWLRWTNLFFFHAGEYEVTIRYSNGATFSPQRDCDIWVNQVRVVPRVKMDNTGSWSKWETVKVKVNFAKGENSIRIRALSKGPNIDNIRIGYTNGGCGPVTYTPGDLFRIEHGLRLSRGLRANLIATTAEQVQYADGRKSEDTFHGAPDGAIVFPNPEGEGWVYVSNSEVRNEGQGGVGAIEFNGNGEVTKYQRLLTGTTTNCSGGKTPWGTWLSCEEHPDGKVYEVDPYGKKIFDNGKSSSQVTQLSAVTTGERYESVACDNRNPLKPVFYYTIDWEFGELRKFEPDPDAVAEAIAENDFSKVLTMPGTITYLELTPDFDGKGGMFKFTSDLQKAKKNSYDYYSNAEGIEFDETTGQVHFVSKYFRALYTLDVDGENTRYTQTSLKTVLATGHADQIRLLCVEGNQKLLYFAEDGGNEGIYAKTETGEFITILTAAFGSEATGLAFSPDRKHLYFAIQQPGLIFDVYREDCRPFGGDFLNLVEAEQRRARV